MSPAKSTVWLPLTRLTAFFVAVVVTGNLLLRAFHTPSQDTSAPPSRKQSFERQKEKAARKWAFITRLVKKKASAPARESETARPRAALFEPVLDVEPATSWLRPVPERPLFDMSCPGCGRDLRGFTEFHSADLYEGLPEAWMREREEASDDAELNLVFSLPERAIDEAAMGLGSIFPREGGGTWTAQDDEPGVTERLFSGEYWTPSDGRTFSRFLDNLLDRERKFLAGFESSPLNTFEYEDGTADLDMEELRTQQQKVLWDAIRKTYLGRFRRMEERVREDALHIDRWRGLDFVVAPVVIGGWAWYRGIERKFPIDGTQLRISVEPLRRIASKRGDEEDDDLAAAVGVEWGVKDFPIKVIVTLGIYDGDPEVDFIGIGTSLGEVRKLLEVVREEK